MTAAAPTSLGDSVSQPAISESTSAGRARGIWSIRNKGLIVIGALVTYAIFIGLFVIHQKNILLNDFDKIQESVKIDGVFQQVDAAAFQAVLATYANINALDRNAVVRRIRLHYQNLVQKHNELAARAPKYDLDLEGVNDALNNADKDPSRANMNTLIQELLKVKSKFSQLTEQAQATRLLMTANFRRASDSVVMTALFLGMLGLVLLGTLTLLFFRQLKDDLNLLRARAMEIIDGHRGQPLPINRRDEVGQLMAAINTMSDALNVRERELMIERQKYFHQEKMAAIGTLAAGVAHEIGNPIAAISGIAQEMVERKNCHDDKGCSLCNPAMILEQTHRIAAITREISEFSSHQTTIPQLLDLNSLLLGTISLMRYDKRLRRVTLSTELDSQLPAIYGVSDQISQVIMNLLVNSMDALEGILDRQPAITITTRSQHTHVLMSIEDNGCGMDSTVRSRIFEAFFTTKAVGHGTGLGLSLCYSIMQKNGGSITIDSTLGVGTCAQVLFPTTEIAFEEASHS